MKSVVFAVALFVLAMPAIADMMTICSYGEMDWENFAKGRFINVQRVKNLVVPVNTSFDCARLVDSQDVNFGRVDLTVHDYVNHLDQLDSFTLKTIAEIPDNDDLVAIMPTTAKFDNTTFCIDPSLTDDVLLDKYPHIAIRGFHTLWKHKVDNVTNCSAGDGVGDGDAITSDINATTTAIVTTYQVATTLNMTNRTYVCMDGRPQDSPCPWARSRVHIVIAHMSNAFTIRDFLVQILIERDNEKFFKAGPTSAEMVFSDRLGSLKGASTTLVRDLQSALEHSWDMEPFFNEGDILSVCTPYLFECGKFARAAGFIGLNVTCLSVNECHSRDEEVYIEPFDSMMSRWDRIRYVRCGVVDLSPVRIYCKQRNKAKIENILERIDAHYGGGGTEHTHRILNIDSLPRLFGGPSIRTTVGVRGVKPRVERLDGEMSNTGNIISNYSNIITFWIAVMLFAALR